MPLNQTGFLILNLSVFQKVVCLARIKRWTVGLGQYECSHIAANESKAYRSNFRLFSLGIVPYSTVIFHMIQSTLFFFQVL